MNIARQIEIVEELLEAVNELNEAYQGGWHATSDNGEELFEHLTNKQIEDAIESQEVIEYLDQSGNGNDLLQVNNK